jgi:hypothetical protein
MSRIFAGHPNPHEPLSGPPTRRRGAGRVPRTQRCGFISSGVPDDSSADPTQKHVAHEAAPRRGELDIAGHSHPRRRPGTVSWITYLMNP